MSTGYKQIVPIKYADGEHDKQLTYTIGDATIVSSNEETPPRSIKTASAPKKYGKTELALKHFDEAFGHAKGDYSTVTARQVYYTIRTIIEQRYGLQLDKNWDMEEGEQDPSPWFKHFKSDVLTKIFETRPDVEDAIQFEDVGVFINPFLGTELPLGTTKVRKFVNGKYSNKIWREEKIVFSIPPNLQYNKVLFVEKRGFLAAFTESGMSERLNMALIGTPGYSSRAGKRLMQYLTEECKLPVYTLHDCDLHGYNIHRVIKEGGPTCAIPLRAQKIGLSVQDVKDLKLTPEEVTDDSDYSNLMDDEGLTDEEREFFVKRLPSKERYVPNPKKPKTTKPVKPGIYRRVELNALTNDQLIAFVESKFASGEFDNTPLKPDDDTLDGYIQRALESEKMDDEAVYKDALYYACDMLFNVLEENPLADSSIKWEEEFWKINYNEVIKTKLDEKIEAGDHWADALDEAVDDYRSERVKRLAAAIEWELREHRLK